MLGRIYVTVFTGEITAGQQVKKDISLTGLEANGTGYRFSGHQDTLQRLVY